VSANDALMEALKTMAATQALHNLTMQALSGQLAELRSRVAVLEARLAERTTREVINRLTSGET
jgi:hypothetical protein